MHARYGYRRPAFAARQRGQAAILTAVLIALGILAVTFGAIRYTSVSLANRIAADNARALTQARDALIGRAVADVNRPGSLPCPDTDDDGSSEIMVGTDCPSYIGRLPWKTLRLPDLRDGHGERLWYALSPNFRDNAAVQPLNSDTKGTLAVYSGSATALLTSEAAAIVFAAGAPVANQVRNTAANQNSASNYLESAFGINNASTTGPYISAPSTQTFNDQLLVLKNAEVMTPVEQRAVAEILSMLASYRASNSCKCYPWADGNRDGVGDYSVRYGGIPLKNALPLDWIGYDPATSWLSVNEWYKVIYYAVAEKDSDTGGKGLTQFTVDATTNVRVVLITSGTAAAGDGRPSSNWVNYVDDTENSDNDDLFVTPSATKYVRDRMYIIR